MPGDDSEQPPGLRTVLVVHSFGPVAGGRRVYIEDIDLHEDRAEISYRLRPGRRESDPLVHTNWAIAIHDDVGTDYEVTGDAWHGDERSITGTRVFGPTPVDAATELTLVVYDAGERDGALVEVGRVTVPLR